MTSKLATSAVALATAQTAVLMPLVSHAQPEGWQLIQQIEITEQIEGDRYLVKKVFPSEMRDGIEQFDLTGYVMLMSNPEGVETFMLVSDMGFCPWCGELDHGASLEIRLEAPVAMLNDGDKVTVRGALLPVKDPESGQYALMERAQILG